ncbi:hypothetical protein [Saccharopolyspora sp. ASAGF58]|uniref:hypothetical protein n=1 Tax=Saccharopolyspora sp. ASAGF58 TaxID=2719023 RepID=UPI001445B322|nr:hypothetical protein [Saccharopolyspora sp. ASAGF58]
MRQPERTEVGPAVEKAVRAYEAALVEAALVEAALVEAALVEAEVAGRHARPDEERITSANCGCE